MHPFFRRLLRRDVDGRGTTATQARLLANVRLTALGVVYTGEDVASPPDRERRLRRDATTGRGTPVAPDDAPSTTSDPSCATTSSSSGPAGTPCTAK